MEQKPALVKLTQRCVIENTIANAPYLFEKMKAAGKTLVWVMKERRMSSGNAQEKFGKFGADRLKSYVGYFNAGHFELKEIHSEFWNSITENEFL